MAASPASASTHLAGVVSQSAPGATPAPAPRRTPPPYSCTSCGLVFDTVTSLNVHILYHKDNLLTKWATQQQQAQHQQSVGTNSNNGPPSNEGRSYDESPPLNNNLNSISKLKQTIQTSPVVSPHPQPDGSYFHTGKLF